jgi:hypothetical protein
MATPMPNTEIQVTSLNKEKVCVGYKYLSTFKAGQILHACEDKVAGYVTNVFDSMCKVEEPFQECIKDMIGLR